MASFDERPLRGVLAALLLPMVALVGAGSVGAEFIDVGMLSVVTLCSTTLLARLMCSGAEPAAIRLRRLAIDAQDSTYASFWVVPDPARRPVRPRAPGRL